MRRTILTTTIAAALATTPPARAETPASPAARAAIEILEWFRTTATCQDVMNAIGDRDTGPRDGDLVRALALAVAYGEARARDLPVGEILAGQLGRCIADMTAPYYPD